MYVGAISCASLLNTSIFCPKRKLGGCKSLHFVGKKYWDTWFMSTIRFNSVALRKAKIVYNFGFCECNRSNEFFTIMLRRAGPSYLYRPTFLTLYFLLSVPNGIYIFFLFEYKYLQVFTFHLLFIIFEYIVLISERFLLNILLLFYCRLFWSFEMFSYGVSSYWKKCFSLCQFHTELVCSEPFFLFFLSCFCAIIH